MDVQELALELALVTDFLEDQRGYSRLHSLAFKVTELGLELNVFAMDGFQEHVEYAKRHFVGYLTFSAEGHSWDARNAIWAKLQALPSREHRELLTLASTASAVIELRDAFVSEAGRSFVAQMTEMRAQYAGLLAAPPTKRSDDEIPF